MLKSVITNTITGFTTEGGHNHLRVSKKCSETKQENKRVPSIFVHSVESQYARQEHGRGLDKREQ